MTTAMLARRKDPASIGRKIAELRDLKGIAQGDLAAAVPTSQKHLSRIEHGHSRPSPAMLRCIAMALGTTASELASV